MEILNEMVIGERSLTYRFVKHRAFRDDLRISYGDEVGDLREAPAWLPWVPLVFNVAPLVWHFGLGLTVPFRHEGMEKGLGRIRDYFSQAYPDMRFAGEIMFNGDPVPDASNQSDERLVLFSGGLDSVHTVFRHIDTPLTLVAVGNAAMKVEDPVSWNGVKKSKDEFARLVGKPVLTVEGNVGTYLRRRLLKKIPALQKRDLNWWTGMQHSLAMLGLCAPIAWARGASEVLIASTYTEAYVTPWASLPQTDDHVAWPGARARHDSYEVTRQGKIVDVVRACRARGLEWPRLRVCLGGRADKSQNCCQCEKCLRTIAGLMVEGQTVAEWGFPIPNDEAISRITAAFARNNIRMMDDQVFMWTDIQCRAALSEAVRRELKEWFRGMDFKKVFRRQVRHRRAKQRRKQMVDRASRLLKRMAAVLDAVRGRSAV